MGVSGALWHLLNFFAPALALGGIAALLAKLLWRRELKGVSVWRMAAWATVAALAAELGGLLWTGHDGKMITYAAMVLMCALALWWAGWGVRRG
ncbi:MAG: hypothetical protein KF891_05080 [Rhizobacter sp.]|nr:hypothetical protein [Rhizobacter sp.]